MLDSYYELLSSFVSWSKASVEANANNPFAVWTWDRLSCIGNKAVPCSTLATAFTGLSFLGGIPDNVAHSPII